MSEEGTGAGGKTSPAENEGERRLHRVLAVFAHPDDETYGPGGTLARLNAEGSEVRLITLTRGESASMGDSPLFSPEFLADVRERELECACLALGISSHELRDFPDGGLAKIPVDALAAPVIRSLKEFNPDLVITFHPTGISGHADHIATSRAVKQALEARTNPGAGTSEEEGAGGRPGLAYYVVPESVASKIEGRALRTVPDHEVTHAIPIEEYFERKMDAAHCHKTQRYILERLGRFPGGIRALWTLEYFIVEGCRRTDQLESDLRRRH